MEKTSTLFLRFALIMIGIAVLALLVFGLPSVIMSEEVGMYRPILIGMYVPALPFYFALYQAWILLNMIDRNKAFSKRSVQALRYIKYSGIAISALYAAGMPYIYYVAEKDDAPGVILIGLVIIFAAFAIATAAGVFRKLLQNAIDIKSENDLTV